MFKKMMLLASMALAAFAVAGPASASAHEWTDNEAGFSGHLTQGLTGFISFGNPEAGQNKFGCEAEVTLTMEGGSSTGQVTAFNVNTAACAHEGELFEGCELVEDQATGLPWTVHITAETKITITNAEVFNRYENCASGLTTAKVTAPDVTVTGTNAGAPTTINTVSVLGTPQAGTTAHLVFHSPEGPVEVTQPVFAFGSLTANTLNTWGIG